MKRPQVYTPQSQGHGEVATGRWVSSSRRGRPRNAFQLPNWWERDFCCVDLCLCVAVQADDYPCHTSGTYRFAQRSQCPSVFMKLFGLNLKLPTWLLSTGPSVLHGGGKTEYVLGGRAFSGQVEGEVLGAPFDIRGRQWWDTPGYLDAIALVLHQVAGFWSHCLPRRPCMTPHCCVERPN